MDSVSDWLWPISRDRRTPTFLGSTATCLVEGAAARVDAIDGAAPRRAGTPVDRDVGQGAKLYIHRRQGVNKCERLAIRRRVRESEPIPREKSPQFDAYAGAMFSKASNGLSNGFINTSTIDTIVGLRFKF